MQPLHQQREPSAYQHCSVSSAQVLPALGGGVGQATGSGSSAQYGAVGIVTCHWSWEQRAVVRQSGRGSSPQLQWARIRKSSPIGEAQGLPSAGGMLGHKPDVPASPLPAPAVPPSLDPPTFDPPLLDPPLLDPPLLDPPLLDPPLLDPPLLDPP
jgi:hypothetical protein